MSADRADVDDRLITATRRADRLAAVGGTVVGISQQAALAGLSVLWTALTAVGIARPTELVWTIIAAIGAVLTVTVWIRGRRTGTLLPFFLTAPERPLAVLTPTQRRELRRQLRRPGTVTEPYAALVRSMIDWQRRSTRAAVPMLVGMFLSAVGLSGSVAMTDGLAGWSLTVGLLAVAVFITVASRVESRRQLRVREQAQHDTR